MHIYFVGIGGTGIGPLALLASQTGYRVSGSDNNPSEYTKYLVKKGITVYDDQTGASISDAHKTDPIDWVVSVSAIIRHQPDHPEIKFAVSNGIKLSERDEFLNKVLTDNGLKMIAASGTQGKTTTTAMLVWVFQKLGIPISFSVGSKMSFADMGHYDKDSEYFIYECDEFHRNFLHFNPYLSVITSIAWDHHEVYPTKEDYNQAFRDFISQSESTIIWDEDAEYLNLQSKPNIEVVSADDQGIADTHIYGKYNRRNAWLVIKAVQKVTDVGIDQIQRIMNEFPGTSRRMEELMPGLFTDYAHTPEKIRGCLSAASELAEERQKKLVVVYEPLTNRRQHFIRDKYDGCFKGVDRLYWVPTFLARENSNQVVLSPEDLISTLDNNQIAEPAKLDDKLWSKIYQHLNDSLVVCMTGGGGKSLDEWLRVQVQNQSK